VELLQEVGIVGRGEWRAEGAGEERGEVELKKGERKAWWKE
jgi:hypothetical protein